jgi:hypothetical protein
MYVEQENRINLIKSICESLEGNKLKLPSVLVAIFKVAESDLFVRESLLHRLKVFGTFLVVAIPSISIIQTRFK